MATPFTIQHKDLAKEIGIKIVYTPTTDLRLLLFILIMRLAAWVGGFGAIEFEEQESP